MNIENDSGTCCIFFLQICIICLFVYSPQDIEQFKAEIEKRQLKDLPIPGVGRSLGSLGEGAEAEGTAGAGAGAEGAES